MQNIEELKKRTIYQNFEDISWIAKNSRSGNLSDIVLLKSRYETLREVIEVGQKQESPHGLERLLLENKLEFLKKENE